MQSKAAIAADTASAIYAYLARGGAIRVYSRGASAIDPATGKAYICPLPVATHTNA